MGGPLIMKSPELQPVECPAIFGLQQFLALESCTRRPHSHKISAADTPEPGLQPKCSGYIVFWSLSRACRVPAIFGLQQVPALQSCNRRPPNDKISGATSHPVDRSIGPCFPTQILLWYSRSGVQTKDGPTRTLRYIVLVWAESATAGRYGTMSASAGP